jgi:hypothetical protein
VGVRRANQNTMQFFGKGYVGNKNSAAAQKFRIFDAPN